MKGVDIESIKNMLTRIWNEPLCSELLSKKIDISCYSELRQQIPDKFLLIREVFPQAELAEIWGNFEEYMQDDEVFPFLGTLGEAVICIGYGEKNKGKIFYFDFDFGCFPLEGDMLEDFLSKLVAS